MAGKGKPGRTARNGTTHRLNLVLNNKQRSRLDEIMSETGALSLTEVIGRALAVYDALWKVTRDNGDVWVRTSDDEELRQILII